MLSNTQKDILKAKVWLVGYVPLYFDYDLKQLKTVKI